MRSSVPRADSSPGTLRYCVFRLLGSEGPSTSRSVTVSQPDGVCQLVSTISVPGTYRRECGTDAFEGPNRNDPADRSNSAPKTLGESGRGKQSHSNAPSG